MPIFRADFEVTCDLVLPDKSEPLIAQSGEYKIMFTNRSADDEGVAPGVVARVVGPADSFDDAVYTLRRLLATQLDTLTFATHSRFSIEQATCVIEWEPAQKTRRYKALQKFDPLYPPDPELNTDAIETALTVSRNAPDYAVAALRAFRYAIIGSMPEEQFKQFWYAVEIIAEGGKERDRIPIPCPKCGSDLWCDVCAQSPTRRPMARQAIRELIEVVYRGDGVAKYRRLITTRDALMHGRTLAWIEEELGQDFGSLVNEVGTLAWHCIMSSIPIKETDPPLAFAHRDGQFVNQTLVVGPVGEFDYDGPDDYPPEDKIPKVQIEQIIDKTAGSA